MFQLGKFMSRPTALCKSLLEPKRLGKNNDCCAKLPSILLSSLTYHILPFPPPMPPWFVSITRHSQLITPGIWCPMHCLLLTSYQFSSVSLWLLSVPFALVKTGMLNIKRPRRSSCMYICHLYHTQSVKMNTPKSSHWQEYDYWIQYNPSEVLVLNLPGRSCEMLTLRMQTTAFLDVGEKHWNFLYRPKAEFHSWKDWFGLHGTESNLCKSTSHTLWFILV